jgi:hypothetical protein
MRLSSRRSTAAASDRVPQLMTRTATRLRPRRCPPVLIATLLGHRTGGTADDRHGRALSDGSSRDASPVGHGLASDRPCRSGARRPSERRRARRHHVAHVDVSTSDARATTRKIRVICGPDPGDSANVRSRRQLRYVTGSTCDEMPCFSRVRAALRAILANSSWRECIVSDGVQIDNAAITPRSRTDKPTARHD